MAAPNIVRFSLCTISAFAPLMLRPPPAENQFRYAKIICNLLNAGRHQPYGFPFGLIRKKPLFVPAQRHPSFPLVDSPLLQGKPLLASPSPTASARPQRSPAKVQRDDGLPAGAEKRIPGRSLGAPMNSMPAASKADFTSCKVLERLAGTPSVASHLLMV